MEVISYMLLATRRNEPKLAFSLSAAHKHSFLYKAPKGYVSEMFCNGHLFLRLFVEKPKILLQNAWCTSIIYYSPQSFQQRTSPIKNQLDHANDLANQFHDVNVVLSHINVNRLEELNTRLAFLVSCICLIVRPIFVIFSNHRGKTMSLG